MPLGIMIWWRFKKGSDWKFGYTSHESGSFFRLGRWNGDTTGGYVVNPFDIEWRRYV